MVQYVYNEWRLFSREIKLMHAKNTSKIYFFSKKEPKSGVPVSEEEFGKLNAIIKENPKTKLPFIKKKNKLEKL